MQTQSNMREISAFFDNKTHAERAVAQLASAGINGDQVRMVAGNDGTSGTSERSSGGFMESLSNFFMPDEDRHAYAEGLERGGYLVSARVADDHYATALDILDDDGSVDMDARSEDWRAEGWSGQYGAADAAKDGTIDVVQEELRIGKRDVSHGRVRVRAYTVEDQVSQDVTLESETVDIERRKVDRAVTDVDAAFRDRTIEIEETAEEAVISKEARVVEEIDVRKDVERHTETVEGTVRHTEVDIEDDRR